MNCIGANAVLENRSGRLITNVIASNSIWPGREKAKPRLIVVTPRVKIDKVVMAVITPNPDGHPYPSNAAATIITEL